MFDTLSDKFHDAFKNIRGKGKISEQNIEDTLKEVRTALGNIVSTLLDALTPSMLVIILHVVV